MKQREIYNGATLANDLTLEGDVVIIGTGAGGGVTAEILAKAGLRVIMVEEGAYRTAKDFKLTELHALSELYFEGALRQTKDKGVAIMQGRTVGGSTTVNWTSSFRTPPQTLKHWGDVHGAQGFSEAEMAPWFEMMEKRLNIHPWEVAPNENNESLARGSRKLGWHIGFMRRNVKNCYNLGYCGFGCPTNAKQGMLITTIPSALDQGAALVTRVRAEKLNFVGDRIDGLTGWALDERGVSATGRKVTVKAPWAVISAGAINSPAFLMRSQVPDPHKTLGKRTFLHVVDASVAVMPQEVDGFQGAPQSTFSDQFLWRDGVAGKLGYKLEVPPMQPVLAMVPQKVVGRALQGVASQYRHLQTVLALMRDGFNEQDQGGTVSLRDNGTPILDYPITPYLWEGLHHAYLTMAECQFAAGAQSITPGHLDAQPYNSWKEAKAAIEQLPMKIPNVALFSAHVMGGCTLGNDPKQSVVDSNGRYHHLPNLAVIDGSAFPTSLGVNPQLSIYGLAARWATQLAKDVGKKA